MSTTVDPRLADDVVQWSDYMWPTIEEFGVPSRLMSEDDWQNWASGLLSIAGFAGLNTPNPFQFDDWREWAFRFNEVINQGS